MEKTHKPSELTHDGKVPMKDRIKESEKFGEQFRSEHSGDDQVITHSENKISNHKKD